MWFLLDSHFFMVLNVKIYVLNKLLMKYWFDTNNKKIFPPTICADNVCICICAQDLR